MTTSQVYVGTYAKYNNGSLQGEWLKLEDYQGKDEFLAACRELHKDEKDPELMFQDHEGIPQGLISESWIDERAWDWLALDTNEQEIVQAYWEWASIDEKIDSALEKYRGTYSSLADYVESFWEETGQYKKDDKNWWSPINYVDWKRMAHDLEMSGDIVTVKCDDGVMVFDNY